MKRALAWAAVVATAIGLVLVTPAAAQGVGVPGAGVQAVRSAGGAAPYCGIYWGSLDKTGTASGAGPVVNVRAGQHQCYDRLVVDVADRAPRYSVGYVPQVLGVASGLPVSLRGNAFLRVAVTGQSYSAGGVATYAPSSRSELVGVGGWQTFRQVAWAGSFESVNIVGLGVRARLPFRVFTLDGPGAGSRLVIDVAHHW